ncbi:MAG TPA: hypothetical protein VJY35_09460 [Candidatus Eisenbacteria bacterium]|nr:hypothetical protein [Candidatus Eisenbacteria bacterium]
MSDFERNEMSSWEPAPGETPGPDAPAPAPDHAHAEPAPGQPVAWKGAASSVPKLREKPVEAPEGAPSGSFQGFAQDAIATRGPVPGAEVRQRSAEDPAGETVVRTPLSVEPPVWELWVDRLRMIPRPVVFGAIAVLALVTGIVWFAIPRDPAAVSLARLRQQPEAYDGRVVHVEGRAGESFLVGGSIVFNLRQGRDTIVVYSRNLRPHMHERVRASGTVSVGYLDGTPRVALFEEPAATP